MKTMSREERREAIEHNRKLYTYSNDKSINGGVLVDTASNARAKDKTGIFSRIKEWLKDEVDLEDFKQ